MTKLYLIRHWETDNNKRGCYYGWTDCSLAESGKTQSHELRRVFKNIEFDVMVTSDLKRAVETANIINSSSTQLFLDERLRELNFGKWEGMTYEEVMEQYPRHWELWVKNWEEASPTEGESIRDMYNRICTCMDDLLAKYHDNSIVIVSHNGVLRMISVYLMKLTLDKMWHFNFEHGRYSIFEINQGHSVIKCINSI